ncbi:MAG: hypothetical protein ACE5JF_03090 [Anaerolineales bacterium]
MTNIIIMEQRLVDSSDRVVSLADMAAIRPSPDGDVSITSKPTAPGDSDERGVLE